MFANPAYLEGRLLRRRAVTKRGKVVGHALWAVKHSGEWPYTEDTAVRGQFLKLRRRNKGARTDCSGFATWCYWMSRLPDPNGLNYKVLGFTGTLLSGAHTVSTNPAHAKPGDLIVVGPAEGDHVYVCVKAGANPLCASHGSPGVELVHLLNDGRLPYRVCISL